MNNITPEIPSQLSIRERIEIALNECRPHLAVDNGGIEFVSYNPEFAVVEVRFLSACKTCPMKFMTLRAGIERAIQYYAPEIKRIEEVP